MTLETAYQETYPRLFALAYRMTGSVSDSEDVIQEAWMRLLKEPAGKVESPPAWLYRTVSNLAIDTLRTSKRTTTGYHGPWLPEPLLVDTYFRSPEAEAIMHEDLSMALMLMLENLSPVQRAVWVLRTSLELSFAEIGAIVDRTAENCRQLFRRAKTRMQGDHATRLEVAPAHLVESFVAMVTSGDAGKVASMLQDDAVWIGDGGGVKPATARPVVGADKVARGLTSLVRKRAGTWRIEMATINGSAGLLAYDGGQLDSVYMFLGNASHISHILVVRNPHKHGGTHPPAHSPTSRSKDGETVPPAVG